jgi:lipopolysaccharide/colanic/teichoic acid biosynthesis glycosyltransferase
MAGFMVVLPGSSEFRLGRSVEAQSSACLAVPLAATAFPFDASGSPVSGESALGEPGVTRKVQELIERQPRHSRVLKRTGDIVFSLAMLSLCSPLLVLLVLLVKITSRGPVFYVQQRVGRGYRQFGCIKFRTMRRDADRILSAVLAASPDLQEEFRNDFKLRNDPRITRLGRFLRRSSLDELPQFVNVLRGEMSVVGPRPIVSQELPRYGKRMEEVLAVRPGLTGLWQVSGRNNLSYRKRVQLDLYYARYRSLKMDMRILLRTIRVVLDPRDRGAY